MLHTFTTQLNFVSMVLLLSIVIMLYFRPNSIIVNTLSLALFKIKTIDMMPGIVHKMAVFVHNTENGVTPLH